MGFVAPRNASAKRSLVSCGGDASINGRDRTTGNCGAVVLVPSNGLRWGGGLWIRGRRSLFSSVTWQTQRQARLPTAVAVRGTSRVPPCQARWLTSGEDVREALALLSEWGARDAVSLARIPKGSKVTFVVGEAAKQSSPFIMEVRSRGGLQLRFLDFDQRWIIKQWP